TPGDRALSDLRSDGIDLATNLFHRHANGFGGFLDLLGHRSACRTLWVRQTRRVANDLVIKELLPRRYVEVLGPKLELIAHERLHRLIHAGEVSRCHVIRAREN